MPSSMDVANYFLTLSDDEAGDLISNLKLQKLVYYAQGFHLALFENPLFEEQLEAWTHGPVVPGLYHAFKEYEGNAIPAPANIDLSMFSEDQKALLDEVYDVYGQFSAWKLRNMTHSEPPWNEAKDTDDQIINPQSMQDYFQTLLID